MGSAKGAIRSFLKFLVQPVERNVTRCLKTTSFVMAVKPNHEYVPIVVKVHIQVEE